MFGRTLFGRAAIKRSLYAVLFTSSCAAALGAVPAVAQDASPTAPRFATSEDIIVTARKTEENVQEIPITIDVLSGAYLDKANITRPIDLQFSIPGLVVTAFGSGARFALRGVGDEGGSGLAVATHLNGVYQASGTVAIQRAFDMERVEVLKGPQGTLYGRNATGGSINYITRAPSSEFGVAVEAGYGSFNRVRSEGYVNLPVDSNLAVRFAYSASNSDGYIRNTLDSRRFGEDDHLGIRGSLRWQPSDRLTIDAMVQHTQDTGGMGEAYLPRPDLLADKNDIRLTTILLADPFLKSYNKNIDVRIGYDLGFATVKSISGYSHGKTLQNRDCTPVAMGCNRRADPDDDSSSYSQELQLVSPGGQKINWIFGVFGFKTDADSRVSLTFGGPPSFGHTRATERAKAVFGQATWNLTTEFSLTGGLRYSDESRTLSDLISGDRSAVSFDDVSWRFDANYRPLSDFMLYASVAKGFKSGGATLQRLPSGAFDTFQPENLIAYETGIKSQWMDRRLLINAAVFYYDFKDLQVFTSSFDPASGGFFNSVDNAASARIYGLDLSTNFRPTERLVLSANVGWLPEREFRQFRNDQGVDLTGNKLSRAPKWSASGSIEYIQPLQNQDQLTARIEVNHRSQYFFSATNSPLLSQGSFTLVNAFLRFEREESRWNAFASVRNLTDQDYFQQIGFQSSPGLPRTYEIGVGMKF